jgi:hypothetical protein
VKHAYRARRFTGWPYHSQPVMRNQNAGAAGCSRYSPGASIPRSLEAAIAKPNYRRTYFDCRTLDHSNSAVLILFI